MFSFLIKKGEVSQNLVVTTISARKRIAAAGCWVASTTICTRKGIAAALRLASCFPKSGRSGIPAASWRVANTTYCCAKTCKTNSCGWIKRSSLHPPKPCRWSRLFQHVEALGGEPGGAVDRGSAQGGWVVPELAIGRPGQAEALNQARGSHSNQQYKLDKRTNYLYELINNKHNFHIVLAFNKKFKKFKNFCISLLSIMNNSYIVSS